MQPTFKAKFLRDGSTALHCKQTGVRYIIAQAGVDHAAYRNGELIRTGTRYACVDAVESDARWGLRYSEYDKAWAGHENDPMRPIRPYR